MSSRRKLKSGFLKKILLLNPNQSRNIITIVWSVLDVAMLPYLPLLVNMNKMASYFLSFLVVASRDHHPLFSRFLLFSILFFLFCWRQFIDHKRKESARFLMMLVHRFRKVSAEEKGKKKIINVVYKNESLLTIRRRPWKTVVDRQQQQIISNVFFFLVFSRFNKVNRSRKFNCVISSCQSDFVSVLIKPVSDC